MNPNHVFRSLPLLLLASIALNAQVARQDTAVPLKNWTTPLYWQPSQTERTATGPAPQLQFSSNQVTSNALTFIAITPCRLVDTRGGAFNGIAPFSGPSIPATTTVTFPVQSSAEAVADTEPAPCGTIPSIAQAYSLNLTVVPVAGGAVDYISMWPSGYSQPFVATLNDPQGAIVANAAIVPAGTVSGGINVYNQGPATANVIIDMNGFFAAPSDTNFNTAIGAGALFFNTTGQFDTATGPGALEQNTTASNNTATGSFALLDNTVGNGNTANGASALQANTTGAFNVAGGWQALGSNTVGDDNTAGGVQALFSNTSGNQNTAIGRQALFSNTTGSNNTAGGSGALAANTASDNTAFGYQALGANTVGDANTGTGYQALTANTTGFGNTATGFSALAANTVGVDDTGIGDNALLVNTTGTANTAVGSSALLNNTTGSFNIAIGLNAAINVAAGNSNNIHIGSTGATGDSNVIAIGSTQTIAKIAGIYNQSIGTTNLQVCIDSTARLGTGNCSGTPSSRRFKDQITDMGDASSKLFQLRPVTFLYKPQYDDGSHALQYGLIAEEVAQLYPEMVTLDKDGQPNSVKYQALTPMLLNEVQKQNARVVKLEQQNRKLEDRLAALETLLSTPTAKPANSQ